jgi:hypothetical protein
MNRRTFLYGGTATAFGIAAAWLLLDRQPVGAGPVTTDAIGDKVQRVPKGELPAFITDEEVRRVYRYAVEHGDKLQYIPCTCGCIRFGHKSNRDCYIKADHAGGMLTFTSHGAT